MFDVIKVKCGNCKSIFYKQTSSDVRMSLCTKCLKSGDDFTRFLYGQSTRTTGASLSSEINMERLAEMYERLAANRVVSSDDLQQERPIMINPEVWVANYVNSPPYEWINSDDFSGGYNIPTGNPSASNTGEEGDSIHTGLDFSFRE